MSSIFVAESIEKSYAHHKALDQVSLSIPTHSIFGLLGPNGAGKTTLIRIMNQITAPDSGHLYFNGEPLSQKHISKIGYLPEERGLYKKMKVGEQAIYLAQLKGLTRHDATQKLKQWFEKFEITNWWDRKVEELSKGMQQKVQFITTILHEPEFLIFDEPFSGFDPINANMLKDEILELKKKGTTIIFSTHNMSSVEEICDHIALINQSKKILDGEVKDIKKTYKKNIFEVCYETETNVSIPLPAHLSLLSSENQQNQHKLCIQVAEGYTCNDLLQHILPYAEIHSFKEVLPSMNDIFIEQVKRTNKETLAAGGERPNER